MLAQPINKFWLLWFCWEEFFKWLFHLNEHDGMSFGNEMRNRREKKAEDDGRWKKAFLGFFFFGFCFWSFFFSFLFRLSLVDISYRVFFFFFVSRVLFFPSDFNEHLRYPFFLFLVPTPLSFFYRLRFFFLSFFLSLFLSLLYISLFLLPR